MTVRVVEIIEAFQLFYDSLWHKDFRKSLRLHEFSERQLLPIVRSFLLGYFGESIVPEAATSLPGGLSGLGRVDFVIDNAAVEFVVRRPGASSALLFPSANVTEVKKLLRHEGAAVLVLYDLSSSPLERSELNKFRYLPAFGRGRHRKSPFSVAYFHRTADGTETDVHRLNVRAN